jgi:hypothetical protein
VSRGRDAVLVLDCTYCIALVCILRITGQGLVLRKIGASKIHPSRYSTSMTLSVVLPHMINAPLSFLVSASQVLRLRTRLHLFFQSSSIFLA